MNVLIIEDEAPAFRRLQRVLEELRPNIQILEVIDTVEHSIKWLRTHKEPDLIFMDIQLADGISFEIFEQIDVKTPVIFTTAYSEYTLKAFKVNSIDYLLKPIDKELLQKSIEKWENLKEVYNGTDLKEIIKSIKPESKEFKKRFLVKNSSKLLSIKTNEIAYFYTENGIVYIKTIKENKFHIDTKLDLIQEQIDPQQFYRLNRQFIVNLDSIVSSHPYDKGKIMVEITPKTELPIIVSRDKASDFKKWLDLG
jgi:DNA-binding LytR/AlgR family response regulator